MDEDTVGHDYSLFERGVSDDASICVMSRLDPGPDPLPESSTGTRSRGWLSEVPALLVTVITTAINAVTYGGLCYQGTAAGSNFGVTVWLLGSGASQLAVTAFSGIPFGIGATTLEMIPILHAIFYSIQVAMPWASDSAVLATCMATCFSATFALGLLLTLGGHLGCAKYLRAVPVVVLKGALFGVALFLLQSAINSSTTMEANDVAGLLLVWPKWGLSVFLGTAIFLIDEVTHSSFLIVLILLTVAATPMMVSILGCGSIEELRSDGWLLPSPSVVPGPWYSELAAIYTESLPEVSWPVVLQQAPALAGLLLTHLLVSLMDLKAVEILCRTDIDLDTELKAIGLSNICSVVCGCGWPTYILCSQNVTAFKLGSRSRFGGVAKVLATIPMLASVNVVMPLMPCALPGCVAWWLGLCFMKETVLDVILQHSSRMDYIIVICMAAVIIWLGMLQGIFVGLLLAMSNFIFKYTELAPVVLSSDSASFLHSNVGRPLAQFATLERLGHHIAILQLEGYIMFGSSSQLTDAVRQLLQPGGPQWILLSFRFVRGLDYSAVCDLAALGRRAAESGCCLVITELTSSVRETLTKARVQVVEMPEAKGIGLCHVPHYQAALKSCEDALLSSVGTLRPMQQGSALAMLEETFADFLEKDTPRESMDVLLSHFEQKEFLPGSTVYRAGDHANFCVGVVTGKLHAFQAPGSKNEHGQAQLMEIVGPGAFVGFAGFLNELPYNQTVSVPHDGEPTLVVLLHWDRFSALMEQEPLLANGVLRSFLRRMTYELRYFSRLSAQH
ncbi:unnamed protein product [Polarella glacialis]|uniref:Sulfate transporter n=1 Tax=Polarella glacialis TaxID=89957 RepID=A0A813L5L8_POLGL|nr:unnamed protein product [Polarella glacialis]CAE8719800.1 unnamed protein product [Polarella glacialis]